MMWGYGPCVGFQWMWIFPLIFLIVILVFFFRGGGWPMCGGTKHRQEESARELLDRRFVRGEISREEYQQMKNDLK